MRSRHDNGPFNIFAEEEITVEFYDLDPMRVVWHGNYIRYFEIGRRVLLEKIRYGYDDMEKSGYVFPVVDISVKYLSSLKFNDRARIKAILIEYENCLRIKYEIRNAETGLLATKGVTTQMAYNTKTNESSFVCPQGLIERVEALIGGQGL
jgi:acyl-CoA thioester hydrolase